MNYKRFRSIRYIQYKYWTTNAYLPSLVTEIESGNETDVSLESGFPGSIVNCKGPSYAATDENTNQIYGENVGNYWVV